MDDDDNDDDGGDHDNDDGDNRPWPLVLVCKQGEAPNQPNSPLTMLPYNKVTGILVYAKIMTIIVMMRDMMMRSG